jgi:NAD(P)-dependent dehydrogenase (short-subunit alcohol dehydrogenase family)
LGLETAKHLAANDRGCMIIAGIRQSAKLQALLAAVPPSQLHMIELDTSSVASAKRFAAETLGYLGDNTLTGVALNAGLQIISGDQFSVEGHELTFATNVLGHMVFIQNIVPALADQSVIVSTASGTHDGDNELAKPYKFLGGFFPSAADVAAGRVSDATDAAQLGRDRYATSKLCNILFTYAMARRYGPAGPRFLAYDPGLMPGTELVRDHPAATRFAWKNILPTAAKLMAGASTAKASGELLAQMVAGAAFATDTGVYIEYTRQIIASSKLSYDEPSQDALMAWADVAARA